MRTPSFAKLRFHLALYSAFWFGRRGKFSEVSKAPLAVTDARPGSLRVFFWTPAATAGASVVVHDVLPSLIPVAKKFAPGWDIQAGPVLPELPVDWLISFKAVPDPSRVFGSPRKILLISDQADVFWDSLGRFDALVATSSRQFAGLLATRHFNVTYLSESEPVEYLAFGKQNLAKSPGVRGDVLLWHGGIYSQDALNALRPALIEWADRTGGQLHVISGCDQPHQERWGALKVSYFPWSAAQLEKSAAVARLGFAPARRSLKKSWLKPASRVRCLYALGVPAIGDERTPDVVEFMAAFKGPLAGGADAWLKSLTSLWNDSSTLARLAADGHAAVAEQFSSEQTARQWIRYLAAGQKMP